MRVRASVFVRVLFPQAILLPADLGHLRRWHGASSSGGAAEEERTAEDVDNLTCLAIGTCTSAAAPEEDEREGEGAVFTTQRKDAHGTVNCGARGDEPC